ncbi:MAG: molybdate ABC transporter substrate-binding protein [Pseudomonadota bacterium]
MLGRRDILLGAGALLATGRAASAQAPLTVFAAASLQESLKAAGQAWTKAGGAPVRFSFGASSAMARQLEQGAPADLFLSADLEWMDWSAQRRLIVPASRRNLLSNTLVLIAPAGSKTVLKIGKGMPLAKALGGGRLAVGDTTAVPAGKYAKAALTALGVWDQLQGRLLPAENVRAALAYVSRGEAPLGIVYATDAKADPKVRVVGTFPASSHAPIVYPGAVTASSRHPRAATLLGFLQGPEASAVFKRYGFGVLARPA